MRVSEILYKGVEQFLSLVPSIETHMQDKENPHAVTKETVGLGNVSNALQATEADFSAHRTEASLDHPDGCVTTKKLQNGAVTGAKIADDTISASKLRAGAVTGSTLSSRCVEETHLSSSLLQTVSSKVDSIDGKGLSQNDFTDELRHKLESISVTDGTAVLDPAALISRTAPLYLRKTGSVFLGETSPRSVADVERVLAFSTSPANAFSIVSYMKKDGNFGCTFFKNGVKHVTYTGASAPGVFGLSMERACYYFVAEASAGMLTIKRATPSSPSPAFSSWTSLPLSTSANIDLRHVFVRRIGLNMEFTIVYFSSSHGTLYVDCHTMPSSGDPVLKWKKTFSCSTDSNYYTSTNFFASWNRFACIDPSGNLYVAPPNCSSEPYKIIKLDSDGAIIDRYHSNSAFNDTLWNYSRDLLLDGKYLYSVSSYGITRFDTATGTEKPISCTNAHSTSSPRGLSLLPDGRLAFYVAQQNNTKGSLLVLPLFENPATSHFVFPMHTLEGTPLLCQNIGASFAEMEGLFLDTETGLLTSKCFAEYTEYAVR